jgi:hypothetical protein
MPFGQLPQAGHGNSRAARTRTSTYLREVLVSPILDEKVDDEEYH